MPTESLFHEWRTFMNSELVQEEIEELTREIKVAADALRLLKKRRRLLEAYLNPGQREKSAKEA